MKIGLCAALIAAFAVSAHAKPPARHLFDIPAGALANSLSQFSAVTNIDVGTADSRIGSVHASALKGRFDSAEALRRLLAGHGLKAVALSSGGWRIETVNAIERRAPPTPTEAAPILVLATKRATPLMRYPGSVTVVDPTASGIDRGPVDTGDVVGRTATVASTALGPGRDKLFIRGIADSGFSGTNQATTAEYLDESRLTYNTPDPNLLLYDVRSVEVLEGPQGTLYGAGTLGGVLRVATRAPDVERFAGAMSGGTTATLHGAPGGDGFAMINTPFGDGHFAIRALGYLVSDGGYLDHPDRSDDDANRVRTIGGRIAARWLVGSGWTVDLRAVGQRIRGQDSQWTFATDGPQMRSDAVAEPYASDYTLGDLTVTHDAGAVRLVSATAISRQDLDERYAGYGNMDGIDLGRFRQQTKTRLISHETRLSRTTSGGSGWLAGIGLFANRAGLNRGFEDAKGAVPIQSIVENTLEIALFAQATVALPKTFLLTAGARATYTRLHDWAAAYSSLGTVFLGGDLGATVTGRNSRQEVRAVPSVALSARPSGGVQLYARYEESNRPGGLVIGQATVDHFQGDRLSAVEAGARYTSSGIEMALALANTRWRNVQADQVTQGGLPITTNIGNARIQGITAKVDARIGKHVHLDAALFANRTHLHDPEATIIIVPDSVLPNVAHFGASAGIALDLPVTERDKLSGEIRVRYVGPSTLGVGATQGVQQGDYIDSQLTARLGNAARGISLKLTNLLNSRGNQFALGSPFLLYLSQRTPQRPFGARLGFDASF